MCINKEKAHKCPGSSFDRFSPDKVLDRSLLNNEMSDFKEFTKGWLEAANREQDRNPFMAILSLWIPFNSWLTQVVNRSGLGKPYLPFGDYHLVESACRDRMLNARFDSLLKNGEFHTIAHEFRSLWPIFEPATLNFCGIPLWQSWNQPQDRNDYRRECFAKIDGAKTITDHSRIFAPKCFRLHGGEPDDVPLDWSHTLSAIYKVRCNLFHGKKSFAFSGHKKLANLSFRILWSIWPVELEKEHTAFS
ncbi:MAG: hypothetical protein CVU57_02395 [Deltaproteobacteria bacterium HGW-Deltaproteobacteria-15]|nr:MAG: hypothetical protein CVU57_02395 [Deltaproteobacteria bacterium HGW-Deltaproteobacteria-15]